jgi:hypothetical protein
MMASGPALQVFGCKLGSGPRIAARACFSINRQGR